MSARRRESRISAVADIRNSESSNVTEEGRKSGHDVSISSSPSSDSSSKLRPSQAEKVPQTNHLLTWKSIFCSTAIQISHRLARILGTLVSSLVPIAAIIVLSIARNMTARLGIVCAFTAIFSVCLSLVTEARRVENFAAAASYVLASSDFDPSSGV